MSRPTANLRRLLPLFVVACVVVASPAAVRAQEVTEIETGDAVDDDEIKPAPKKPEKSDEEKAREALIDIVQSQTAGEIRRVYAATLRAEIDEMAELFDLEEPDVRKLGLAARGAASKSVEKNRTAIMATVKRMMDRKLGEQDVSQDSITFNGKAVTVAKDNEDAAAVPEDETPKADDKAKLGITVARRSTYFYFTVRYKTGSSSTSVGPRDSQLRSEEIWKKTTGDILTPEQMKEYATFRQGKLKSAVITSLLASMQFELHLRDSQLPAVRKEIEKQLGTAATSAANGIESAVQQHRRNLKVDGFAGSLSEQQMELWKSSQAYYRRYLQ